MTIELLRSVLGWCALINYGVLMIWACFIWFGHDWLYRLHTRWFTLTVEEFDVLHYGLIGGYKLAIFIFNLAPYLALLIVSGSPNL